MDAEGIGLFFVMILISIVITYILGFMVTGTHYTKNIIEQYDNKTEIYSLSDNLTTQNKFVLGTGSTDGKIKYYTLVGNNQDGYIIKSFSGEATYIVPEENIKPYYLEKHNKVRYDYEKNFIIGILFKPIKSKIKDEIIKTEIHLPQGYISQQYSIDLK
jgi:hypothetical protein